MVAVAVILGIVLLGGEEPVDDTTTRAPISMEDPTTTSASSTTNTSTTTSRPTTQTQPPTTDTTVATGRFVGQWLKPDPLYDDLPGELLVVDLDADGYQLEAYSYRAEHCDPISPAHLTWTGAIWDEDRLVATTETGICSGRPRTDGAFTFNWVLQSDSASLLDANGDYWYRVDGLDPTDFVASSPYVGSWTRTSSTSGGTYLYVIGETPTGFALSFYADSAWWCAEEAPFHSENNGTLGPDGSLSVGNTETTCLGSPTGYDTDFESTLTLDLLTGTLIEGGDDQIVWHRTYDIGPGDLYPGA